MSTAVTSATTSGITTSNASTLGGTTASEMQDRFLKLLVAQMNNQDPMNPMDNAQMTAQMAQINTVSGIQQLNDTVKGLASQFDTLQALQSASLVGRQVLTEGNTLTVQGKTAQAAVNLSGPADKVTVQVTAPTGQVLDTFELGALAAGQQPIVWDASNYTQAGSPTFKVTASNGTRSVQATPLSVGVVTGVSNTSSGLLLQMQDGSSQPYSAIKTIL
jgi:flagellar basal-body rod modification protein FlgD